MPGLDRAHAALGGGARRGALLALVRARSEEHTSELQSQSNLVCRLLLEKKKKNDNPITYLSKSIARRTALIDGSRAPSTLQPPSSLTPCHHTPLHIPTPVESECPVLQSC